jgi:hypothetical protein
MPESSQQESSLPPIDLKNPLLAGFLAWLVPGLGHLYQGRYAKAALFFICIMGVFVYGIYLGSSAETGWGRDVYLSFRSRDLRLHFLCQVGVGLPTMPAVIQWLSERHPPRWGGFMARPPLEGEFADDPSVSQINRQLHGFFEFGTAYTMIAGLLNLLAIYDACCGPVPPEAPKKKEEDDEEAATEDSP